MSCRVRVCCRGTSRGGCSSGHGGCGSGNSNTQPLEQPIIRWLLDQVLIPGQRSSPAGKRTRDPGVLVCVIPDCKSDTACRLYA